MLAEFEARNFTIDGKPAGGYANGAGMEIKWQNSPLGRGDERSEPNGALVETVIAAAKQRIEYYQESDFSCSENALAIKHLEAALAELNSRTVKREAREVEGTHTI